MVGPSLLVIAYVLIGTLSAMVPPRGRDADGGGASPGSP